MGGVLGRSNVEDFPFEIILEGLKTFECDFEREGGEEGGWVVQDSLSTILCCVMFLFVASLFRFSEGAMQ